jgi:hypothetical protein
MTTNTMIDYHSKDFLAERVTKALDRAGRYIDLGWVVVKTHAPIFSSSGRVGCTCEHYKRGEHYRQWLAERGREREYNPLYICPNPGKHPAGNWKETTDVMSHKKAVALWGNLHRAVDVDTGQKVNIVWNIGVLTGPSNLLTLDADTYKGHYQCDLSDLIPLDDQETPQQFTHSGGLHFVFDREGKPYSNANGELRSAGIEGVDIRGGGGFQVTEPSIGPSGNEYAWIEGYEPWNIAPHPIPVDLDSLLSMAVGKRAQSASPVSFTTPTTEKPDFAQWGLHPKIMHLLHNPPPVGQRSEADQKVITALIHQGASNDAILAFFEHTPLGTQGKFAEKGRDYLAYSIGKARAYVELHPTVNDGGVDTLADDNGFGPVPAAKLDDEPSANGTPGSASTGQQRKTRVSAKIDKATQIYQLALQHCQIFTGDDGAVYATVEMSGHFENMNVRSMRFRQWLGKLYYDEVGAVAGKSSCDEAVEVLSFQTGTAVKTFLRVGGTDTSVYLDLGNSQWEAVEIDANGWRILGNAPVRFRRTAKMQPLPTPVKTNVEAALVELFSLINIAAEDRMLVIAWLLAAMRHKGPYPVLTLIAEPGSAKTTTAKALKRLISPYVAETRSRPKTVEDVYVASNNDWILVYDNLSSIPLDISDAFCRMATGGGFATRELYANLEEVVIDQQQPLIINGVADIVRKGDLASRIVTVTLPTITTDNRIDESEWEKRFTDAHPRILGALLDLLSYVTAELPKVKCPLPRMADFAKLGVALDTATGITGEPHSFAERYAESNRQGTMTVIENSATYRPLWRFMEKVGSWEGTAASLLEELRKVSTFTEKLDLPKAGNALVKEMNGIAPNLRTALIIDIRCGRTKKGSHISLTKLSDFDRGELDNAYSDTEPESTPGF